MLLGAHISAAGGVSLAPKRGKSIGCDCIQIFSKNQLQWVGKPIPKGEAEAYKENKKKFGIKADSVHTSYLINLASPKKSLLQKSREAFVDELKRCEQLGIQMIIFHPGAHMAAGVEAGLKTITESINWAHAKTEGFKVKTTLENTAGAGTVLCSKFDEIAQVFDLISDKKRMALCLDTCHTFAAGYDLKGDYDAVMKALDKTVGVNKVHAFHLNDAKAELNSHLDRHEAIGKGNLGKEFFRKLMNDSRFKDTAGFLETPYGDENYKQELKLLRSL